MLNLDASDRALWSKTDRDHSQPHATHPLICHLIDVAQVVGAVWDTSFPTATQIYFGDALQLERPAARQWLAFLAGLHDLGKASPGFQAQHPPAAARLRAVGFDFPDALKIDHGTISTCILERLMVDRAGLDGEGAHSLAVALGGHHGTWPDPSSPPAPKQCGGRRWGAARLALLEALGAQLNIFHLPRPALPGEVEPLNTLCVLLAGLTSFADWIGSMSQYFRFAAEDADLTAYAGCAYRQALDALDRLGWSGWAPAAQPLSFQQLFPFPPRPLQRAMVELAPCLVPPALVIVEAPTGEGKTEAGWYLADHWLAAHQQRGTYVAMPTQATSNQMLGRVRRVLERRYPGQRTNLILLHGDAAWSADMQQLRLAAVDDAGRGSVAAHAWFLPKKRGLLAPFAVGTVDQAHLAVLQTRHFFIRLFGLSHKTVIFDEVHAYDTYMNVLFRRLLRWLAAMGTSVVLLSATLPAGTRRQLVEAYTGHAFEQPTVYPAITWATSTGSGVVPLAAAAPRTIRLEWLADDPEALLAELRRSLSEGGCAAVLCNTVGRAQLIFQLICEARLVPEPDLILFHARFPFGQRQQIERTVVERFGQGDSGQRRGIVVATQVIEQSLDLDFDLIVTDLAPVDLIIQRAGRLHRHAGRSRPAPLAQPRLVVVQPGLDRGVPSLGDNRYVYASYVLLRSYLGLAQRSQLSIPDDVQPLIEAIYGAAEPLPGSLSPAWQEALAAARARHADDQRHQEFKARLHLILPPDDEDVLFQDNHELEEDQPELHETLQALTRDARPGVTLVCLHRVVGGVALDAGGDQLVDLDAPPDEATACQLAQRKVTLSHPRAVQFFRNQPTPPGWREHAMLRAYRPAIFEQGRCVLEDDWQLILDPRLGLMVAHPAQARAAAGQPAALSLSDEEVL